MPRFARRSGGTVRQGPASTISWAVYAFVFLGVGAVAYWRGGTSAPPPAASEATAVVLIQEADAPASRPGLPGGALAADAFDLTPMAARPDPLRIRRQVLAWADEPQRDRVRVETTAEALRGRWRIAITLRDTPDQTVRAVNALAQSCAESYRAEWKSSVDRAYNEAHAATERTAGRFRDAQAQLDELLQRQIEAAQRASKPPRPAPAIENPDWTELNRQKTALQERRQELLATRTPIHPAVQDLDFRIEMLQQRMASVPRQVPGDRPNFRAATGHQSAASVGVGPKMGLSPLVDSQVAEPSSKLPETPDPAVIRGLQRSVAEATRVHNEALRLENLAVQARLREPKVGLQLAIQPPPSPPRWPAGAMALLGALGTGLASVAGLGMIFAGASIEPALGTTARLQAALAVPVLGTVPGDTSAPERASSPARQRLLRWALILLGLAALASSAAMLWLVHPTLVG